MEDDGMMDHAIDNGSGDNGIPKIIAEILKIDVGRHQCRTFAVTTVDNFEEQRSIFGVLLLQPVKA